nr:TAM domain methyltransferase [Colletotrichum truncatum]KAF6793896.1 TAM domain methyltransferase [Colletotrichum truncatum]
MCRLDPITEKENEAQYILHHALTVFARGGRFLTEQAEFLSGRILDLETGSGIWPVELARLSTKLEVIVTGFRGLNSWLPDNVKIMEDWSSVGPFDVVHKRFLFPTKVSWELLFKSTKPNGHIEVEIVDWRPYGSSGNLLQESCLFEWAQMTQNDFQDIQHKLEEAGFINVIVKSFELPIGPWNKQMPRLGEFFSRALFEMLKISAENNDEAKEIIEKCIEETKNPKMHAKCKYLVVTGRRPWER